MAEEETPTPDDDCADPPIQIGTGEGDEIVISPDGQVFIPNATKEMIEIALALDPDNEDLKRRLEVLKKSEARKKAREAREEETE